VSRVPLNQSKSATISAAGIARLEMGPTVYGHKWNIRRMVVSSTSDLPTEARVYLNANAPSALLAGSYAGNQDFNETDVTLQTLDRLLVEWINGTPGAIATFQVQGIVEAVGRI
jgi:hypothetical protein